MILYVMTLGGPFEFSGWLFRSSFGSLDQVQVTHVRVSPRPTASQTKARDFKKRVRRRVTVRAVSDRRPHPHKPLCFGPLAAVRKNYIKTLSKITTSDQAASSPSWYAILEHW